MKKAYLLLLPFTACLIAGFISAGAGARSNLKTVQRVSFIAVGDNLLHNTVISDMKTADGYNFLPLYASVRDKIEAADISFVNQEGIFAGESHGYSGYPLLNAPNEAGKGFAEIGFDIIGYANNHALDFGEEGILRTIDFWKTSKLQVLPTGIYSSQKQRSSAAMIEKNGIKIAVLSYTDSTNGISLPEGKEYLVSTADPDAMEADLTKAKSAADIVVVFMHWGEEYKTEPSTRQKNIARYLSEHGANLIVGCHPHVLQPAQWITNSSGDKTLVVYSLGNFISSQHRRETLLGALLSLSFERMKDGRVEIKDPYITPIVTHYEHSEKGFRIYPLAEYTDNLALRHGITEFDKPVSKSYFENLAKSILGDFYQQ